MKSLLKILLGTILIFSYSCATKQDAKMVTEIDSLVQNVIAKTEGMEQKTFVNPQNSEAITGYFEKDNKPALLKFDSYPDFVQYYYNDGIACIIHNVIGEGGVSSSESKYYFKDGKLFYYINNKEAKEITADVEKASKELLDVEAEYLKTLSSKGKTTEQKTSATGSLDFLADFADKPSYDISEDERLTSRLKAIVKGDDNYSSLISQLAYGDAIQKFDNTVVINGQIRQTVDEQGTQFTFVSIIVADLKNNVLSVGMTDEEGNTSIFFTEAPGTKYPKQLVDWFTQDYRNQFKMEVQ